MTSKPLIDWAKPIETVDGRPMQLASTDMVSVRKNPDEAGDYYLVPPGFKGRYFPSTGLIVNPDGSHWLDRGEPLVRNVETISASEAIAVLKAEGYTVDETTGVISPPDPVKEAREFLADLMRSMHYELLARSFLRGEVDHKIANAIKFLNENKYRIPKNTENT